MQNGLAFWCWPTQVVVEEKAVKRTWCGVVVIVMYFYLRICESYVYIF